MTLSGRKKCTLRFVELILTDCGYFDRSTIQKSLSVLRGDRKENDGAKMISAEEVMTLLDCSRPYLYTLERAGKLHPVRYTPRKVAYNKDEVLNLKYGEKANEKRAAAS